MMMKVIKVEPGKPAEEIEMESTLEALQQAVGGYIETVYPFEDDVALICNEEGKLDGLPFNRSLYADEDGIGIAKGERYDIIAGTFLIVRAPEDSDKFTSLTDKQMKTYLKMYKEPEVSF